MYKMRSEVNQEFEHWNGDFLIKKINIDTVSSRCRDREREQGDIGGPFDAYSWFCGGALQGSGGDRLGGRRDRGAMHLGAGQAVHGVGNVAPNNIAAKGGA